MSSHHFVKDGQEPALFILDNISFQYVESLLEWVPLVIVSERVLEQVLQWRIKIDVVIQKELVFETLADLVKDQGPVQILRCGSEGVAASGLRHLIENGYEAVNLLSQPSKDIFREVEESAGKLQVGIYTEQQKWSLITSGKFEKWMPAESTLQIRNGSSLQTDGVVQKGSYWETVGAGIVSVRSESAFWVGEQP
jgi:hypothetical protein